MSEKVAIFKIGGILLHVSKIKKSVEKKNCSSSKPSSKTRSAASLTSSHESLCFISGIGRTKKKKDSRSALKWYSDGYENVSKQ